jgi:hypothetical protein
MNRERAEAHLRLLAEAELRRVPVSPVDGAVSHRLALVTQALAAVGAIDAGRGEQIQAELELALAMRPGSAPRPGPGWPSPAAVAQDRMDRLAQLQSARSAREVPVSAARAWPAASWRLIPVGQVIQIREAELLLLTYVQTAEGARFTTAAGPFSSAGQRGSGGMCGSSRQRPYRFTATDDQGTTCQLSGRTGSRAGLLELQPDPPAAIRWLDLTPVPGEPAIRVDLAPPDPAGSVPAITVTRKTASSGEILLDVIAAQLLTVAVTFPRDTAERRAAARRELLWLAGEDRLGDIITALQAADALPAASPVPGQLARLCTQLGISGHGITAPAAHGLPEPWESMLTRYRRPEPGPALAPGRWASPVAELPEQDGTRIAVLDVHHGESGTVVYLLVSGVTAEDDWPYGRVVRPLPALWIRDSSDRWHTTQVHGTGRTGGHGEVVLWLDVKPPLDRGTTWIDVVAAGQSAEARATVPLRGWGPC